MRGVRVSLPDGEEMLPEDLRCPYSQALIACIGVKKYAKLNKDFAMRPFRSQTCNDHGVIGVHCSDNVIEKIGYMYSGCALGQATCELMCKRLEGKTLLEAKGLVTRFIETEDFGFIKSMPHRVTCVTNVFDCFLNLVKG